MIYIFCQYQAIVDILKHFYIFLWDFSFCLIFLFVNCNTMETYLCFCYPPLFSYHLLSHNFPHFCSFFPAFSVPFFPHFLFLFSSILGRKCPSNRTQFLFVTYLKSGTSVIVLIVQYNNNYVWLNKFSLGCKNHSFYLYAPYNNRLMFSEKMVE